MVNFNFFTCQSVRRSYAGLFCCPHLYKSYPVDAARDFLLHANSRTPKSLAVTPSCSAPCCRYLPYEFHVNHLHNCIYKLQISRCALNVPADYHVNLLLILVALIAKHCVPFRYTFQVDAMFLQHSATRQIQMSVTLTHIDWCPRMERTPY